MERITIVVPMAELNWEEKFKELVDPYNNGFTECEDITIEGMKSFIRATVREAIDEVKVEPMIRQEIGHRWNLKQPLTYYAQTQEEVDSYNSAIDAFEEKKKEVRKQFE